MTTFPPSKEMAENAHVNAERYAEMYAASSNDPDAFWGEHGKRLDWSKPYTKVKNTNFNLGEVSSFEVEDMSNPFLWNQRASASGKAIPFRWCR